MVRHLDPSETPISAPCSNPISKQMSLPPFVFLEAIRHIRHFFYWQSFQGNTLHPLARLIDADWFEPFRPSMWPISAQVLQFLLSAWNEQCRFINIINACQFNSMFTQKCWQDTIDKHARAHVRQCMLLIMLNSWRLKSFTTRLFVHKFVHAKSKEKSRR